MEVTDKTKEFFKGNLDLGHYSADRFEKGQGPTTIVPVDFSAITLTPAVHQAVARLGFTKSTPIQTAVIPLAVAGRDVVAQAKTGSGKTIAFVLPLLVKLEKARSAGPINSTFGLIVTPTRELAQQIVTVIESLDPELKPVQVIGGESIDRQLKQLQSNPQVVVGTPGRILDLIERRALQLQNCRFFTLDEADEMFSMGFYEDVQSILVKLPKERQGLFVSATISPRVRMLAGAFLTNAEQVMVGEPGQDLPPIEHLYCSVAGDVGSKPSALCDLIEALSPRSAIIFCNTKSDTELVEVWLRRRAFDARRINSDLSQSQRSAIMNKIRAGELRLLVATDVAARGLDIEAIELVIHYSLHTEVENYMHRSGRTGRAGNAGKAISLIGPLDMMAFRNLKLQLPFELKEMPLPTEDEVAAARTAHFYQLLRGVKYDLKPIDTLIARKLLKEAGGIQEVSDGLAEVVGKLCGMMLAQAVKQDTRALDDELDAAREAAPQGRDSSWSGGGAGDRGGQRGGGGGYRGGRGGGSDNRRGGGRGRR